MKSTLSDIAAKALLFIIYSPTSFVGGFVVVSLIFEAESLVVHGGLKLAI